MMIRRSIVVGMSAKRSFVPTATGTHLIARRGASPQPFCHYVPTTAASHNRLFSNSRSLFETSQSPPQQQPQVEKKNVQQNESSASSEANQLQPAQQGIDYQAAYAKMKQLSEFYWNATKTMFVNMHQAYQLRQQISNRIFRKATRREIMFINSNWVDACKFIPFFALFCVPFSSLLIPAVAYFVPSFLPSHYQSQEFLNKRRTRHSERRKEMSYVVNQEFLRLTSEVLKRKDSAQYHLEASLLQVIIQRVKEERVYTSGSGSDFIHISCRVLEDLIQLERANGLFDNEFNLNKLSKDVIRHISLFSLASRSEYGGVSGGTSTKYGSSLALGLFSVDMNIAAQNQMLGIIPVPSQLRKRALKKYIEMIKADDYLIEDFSVYNLKSKEVLQALYVRGFNVYGDKKFTINEMQELLKCWLQFSKSVKSETLRLLAPIILWW